MGRKGGREEKRRDEGKRRYERNREEIGKEKC